MTKYLILIIALINIIMLPNIYAKTTLITASTGSFGQAISLDLASQGQNLILAGRNQEKLDILKKDILEQYSESDISTIIIDFSDIQKIQSSIENTSFKKIDSVVLMGPRVQLGKNNPPSPEEWQKSFKETFTAPLETLKLLIPHMNHDGSIIVISGSTSKGYLPNFPNSNVIRLAWVGEVKNLMHFVSPKKIRVNAISPSLILTEHHYNRLSKKASENNISFDEYVEKNTSNIPLGRYGKLSDVTNLVSFLISDKSAYINGTNILLDGGKSNSY